MPEKIGQYTIVSQLGRGGMGIVYKAKDEALNRFVAIKVLTEQLTEDDTFLQRFVREAQAAAGVSHPNLVQIFHIGEDAEKHPYFVMEYVSGRSLNHVVRSDGRIGNPRASQIILQAAHGLAAAHDQGIIHRDIKLANLMLDDRGIVKIADFGLALPVDAEHRLTATGMMVGTPGYLSPEQCRGEKVDGRTDIYALGITFYELLSGSPPFRGESPLALLRQILDEEPPDITSLNPSVDAESRRILQKMIAKDRAQRYQNCHELVADLEEYLAKHGVRSVTAGLSTPKPATAEIAAARDQATQVVSATAAPAAANIATAIVSMTSHDAPTLAQAPFREPATLPGGASLPVVPVAAPPAPAPVVAAKSGSSSRALLIVAALLLLVVGGGVAAAMIGWRMYQSRVAEPAAMQAMSQPAPEAAAQKPVVAPAVESQGVLLSQGVTPTTGNALRTETAAPAVTNNVPANVAQQPAAQPVPNVVAPSSSRGGQAPSPVTSPATTPARATAAPARARSGIAVAVTGDRGLTGAVSSVLTAELSAAGLDAVDAATLPATEDLVRGDVSAARLIDRLRNEGQAMLVLARVEPTGERQLSYMGRSDTAYSSRITITTYDLASGRPVGSPSSTTIEYTSRTADREAEKVIGKLARTLASTLENR